jgi:hypothetical protein
MKQFFEKLTYIYIFDIKENKYKHIVYYYLREHIMKYIPFNGLTNQINYIVNEQDKMNEKYNIYKEKMLKETKDFIECELKKDFTLKFVDYGSHYSNLYLPDSDLDFRVFFKEKDKMNPVNENEFMQKLDEIFGKMKKEIQKNPNNQYHLEVKSRPRANPPLFTLEFNIYNIYNSYYIYNIYNNYIYTIYNKELIIVKIDVTFGKDTGDENGINYSEEIINKRIKHINNELAKNPSMRKNILVTKLLTKHFDMNSTFNDGISSYISILLYISSAKKFKNYFDNNDCGEQLVLFFWKYSNYQYDYYIDKNGIDKFLSDEDKDSFFINNQKYGNNKETDVYKRFYVDDPVLIEHSNAANKCHNHERVKLFFFWMYLEIKDGNNIIGILNDQFLYPELYKKIINE